LRWLSLHEGCRLQEQFVIQPHLVAGNLLWGMGKSGS
jgi:hypothetical protein